MKPGDLVTPVQIKNSHVNCYRMYDIPEEFTASTDFNEWKIAAVVDKFFIDEIGLLLQTHSSDAVKVLSPRGVSGWVDKRHLKLIE